jgi:hypothetical protein
MFLNFMSDHEKVCFYPSALLREKILELPSYPIPNTGELGLRFRTFIAGNKPVFIFSRNEEFCDESNGPIAHHSSIGWADEEFVWCEGIPDNCPFNDVSVDSESEWNENEHIIPPNHLRLIAPDNSHIMMFSFHAEN